MTIFIAKNELIRNLPLKITSTIISKMKTQSLTNLAAGLVLACSLFTAQAEEFKKKKSDCKECPDKTQSSKTESMEREIWAAAKAGKISKEEAMKKLSSLKGKQKAHGNHAKGAHGDPRKAKYQAVEREIIAAVKAGKLSKEEAGKKLESMKKSLWGQSAHNKGNTSKRINREQAEKMGRDIAAAVKAGKLSREEAHKKSQAIRKMVGAGQSDHAKQHHPNHHHNPAHSDRRGNDRNLAGEVDALRREIHELKRALEATRRHHGDRHKR